jgi:hypothetical protein
VWYESINLAIGIAVCDEKDVYNRKFGNHIARERALKALARGKSCGNWRWGSEHNLDYKFMCNYLQQNYIAGYKALCDA